MLTWLDEVDADDRDTLGTKAAGQGRLLETDVAVPRGFVVPPRFFSTYLQHHGIEDEVRGLLRQDTDQARNRVRSLIDDHELPEHLQEQVSKHYDEINLSKGVRNAGSRALELIGGQREQDFVCVRASSGSPDTGCRPEMSITGGNNVGEAIRTLWKRFFSPTSLAVREDHTEHPTVIVQRMIDPEVAGTVYTQHPVTGEDEVLVESIYGLGNPLYDGETEPDLYRIDRNTGKLEERQLADKEWKKVQDPSTGSIVRRRVPTDDQETGTLDDAQLKSVADEALDIEAQFDGPVRIDFVVGRNRRQVLDTKPVPEVPEGQDADTRTERQGLGLSAGRASGTLTNGHGRDSIALLDTPSREKLPRLPEMDAWVSPRRGISTGLATASRRLGRPAIGGISADDLEGTDVTLDGRTGRLWQDRSSGQDHDRMAGMAERSLPSGPGTTSTSDRVQTGSAVQQGTGTPEPQTSPELTSASRERSEQEDGPMTALAVYGVSMDDAGLDGRIVRARGGFDWESRPVLHTADREDQMRLIDSYDAVFEDGEGPLLIHTDALGRAASAAQMRSAVEYLLRTDHECVLLLKDTDQDLLELAVRGGADGIAVTASAAETITHQLERVEKRVLLDLLRDRR